MPRSLPDLRTVALVVLLVGGVALSFSFHAAADGVSSVTYTATPVEPGEDPELVARAAVNVTDLGDRLSGTPARHREPVRTAAATGSYTGDLDPELDIVVDDIETRYVLFDGRYYDWALSTSPVTTNATIRMTPVDSGTVFDTVARPVAGAPAEVRTAVEEGSSVGLTVESGVYRQQGTYYVVAPENEGAVLAQLAGVLAGLVLTPVGRGYVAVALALLGYRYRDPTSDRPLSARRAAAAPALAVPVAFAGAALFESGSLARFVMGPATAFVVAAGALAGVFAKQRRWGWLVGTTFAVGLAATAAVAAAIGLAGLLFGPILVVVGLATGLVPFGYGYWFARESDAAGPS